MNALPCDDMKGLNKGCQAALTVGCIVKINARNRCLYQCPDAPANVSDVCLVSGLLEVGDTHVCVYSASDCRQFSVI